jgi:hypothetical protein
MDLDLTLDDLLDVGENNKMTGNNGQNSSDGFKESIKNKTSSLGDLSVDILGEVNTTIAVALFFAYLVLNSSPFLFNVIPSYMEGTQVSQEGILIQAILLTFFYIIIHMLYDTGCI